MATDSRDMVLETREFRLLDGLRLTPKRTFSGRVRGERISKRKGISIEFADFRDYGEGDDLRHLDWNVLARLEMPVIKTYQDEEDLAVHLLVDTSASMDFGAPTKTVAARKIACALGYVALCGQDALMPFALGRREPPLRPLRSRSSYPKLAAWASGIEADSQQTLMESLRDFAASGARPGLVIIISDGLDPNVFGALRVLGGRGHEVSFVHLLSLEELDPDLEGDLRLIDAEKGQPVEVTAGGNVLKQYRQRLDEHCSKLTAECLRIGGRYVQTTSGESLQSLIGDKLKREGWLAT